MEKVKRFFRELHEKRAYQIVFFVVSMCVILCGYFGIRINIEKDLSRRYTVVSDKNVIKFVEDVVTAEDVLTISGWCFYKNVDSNNNNIQVFLRNINDEDDVVWLDVEPIVRKDVDAYFDCEYDYSCSGFMAHTSIKKVNLQNKDYEIFLKLNYKKQVVEETEKGEKQIEKEYVKTVSTNRYIINEKYTAFKSGDKEPIKTASKEINEVFDKGQLLVYREDVGVYIYQYKGKIYWVAEESFNFEEDKTTTIQYQIDTTRIDKLPARRLENEWYWDNCGFVFESKELEAKDTIPYRVAAKDIPTTYPVSYFWTGYVRDDVWLWTEYLTVDIRDFDGR